MCWSKYEQRWVQDEEARKEEELQRIQFVTEKRAARFFARKKAPRDEPVRELTKR